MRLLHKLRGREHMPPPDSRWLFPREVAARLKVSPATVRQWAREGVLRSVGTPGGHSRFPAEEIDLQAARARLRGARASK